MRRAEVIERAGRSDDPDELAALSRHEARSVRQAVATNGLASDATVSTLLDDPDPLVRLTVAAENLRDRPGLQMVAARSPDKDVRAVLAHTFAVDWESALPIAVQELLAADESPEVRGRTAETTTDAELFEQLLRDDAIIVRAHCAANPRINHAQMTRLVSDRRAEVRATVAGRGLRYPDDDQLIQLASDRSANVRWAVLFRVDRPREALLRIAQDPDEWNRQHAQLALQRETLINGPAVIEYERAERARARALPEFGSGTD